jgi:RNA-binding protein
VTEHSLSGKDRAALRAEAHHLTPTVHVGQHGLTPTLVQSLDDALRTRELVKVQLGRQVELKAKEAAQSLAEATSSAVVQVIGKTVTLYRENPEIPGKKGDPPPWRR